MQNQIILQINQLYLRFLNRTVNQNELVYYKQLFQTKQFSFQNTIQLILNSEEFTRKSLQDLTNIFKALEIDIETIEETKIIFYIQKLKQGFSLFNLTSDIINEYKKQNKNQNKSKNIINDDDLPNNTITNMIQNVFQKILERQPTKEELIQYKQYNENSLENILLHTIECSNLIDHKLQKMVDPNLN